MALKQNNPGCQCCCVKNVDAFDRADSTDLGVDWDERSGSWEIASNNLKPTSSAGLVTFERSLPAGTIQIKATGRTNTDGDTLRLVADYVDDDNYHFADFTFGPNGTAKVQLGDRDTGAETILGETRALTIFGAPTLTKNNDRGLYLNIASDRMAAWHETSVGSYFGTIGIPITSKGGTKVALGTGTIAGTVTFNDFKLMRSTWDVPCNYDTNYSNPLFTGPQDCCPQRPCGAMLQSMGPKQFKIVLAGYSGQGVLCSATDDTGEFNGTFYSVPYYYGSSLLSDDGCSYNYSPVASVLAQVGFVCGTADTVALRLQFGFAGNSIRIEVYSALYGTLTTFSKTITPPYDAWSITNLDIPLSSDASGSIGSPTCTLTAIL